MVLLTPFYRRTQLAQLDPGAGDVGLRVSKGVRGSKLSRSLDKFLRSQYSSCIRAPSQRGKDS